MTVFSEADQKRLESLLRTRRRTTQEIRDRASLHRAASAELARLTRLDPHGDRTVRMSHLVRQSHLQVHASAGSRFALLQYLASGYWRSVRALGPALALATLAFCGASLAAMLWGILDEQSARSIVPASFIDGAAPPKGGGISPAESAAFSSELFTNNIQVTFMAFAAGLLFGAGTLALLIYNGAIFGAVLGIAAGNGNLGAVLQLVVAHGLIELSCIVVCAAAGMWMGWAILRPGRLPRSAALTARATVAVRIVLGTAPWLVLAGVIEAFISPQGFPAAAVLTVGAAAFATYWTLVARAGRAPDADASLAPR